LCAIGESAVDRVAESRADLTVTYNFRYKFLFNFLILK